MALATLLVVFAAASHSEAAPPAGSPTRAGPGASLAVVQPPSAPERGPSSGGGSTPERSIDFGLRPGQSLHAVLRTDAGTIDCTLAVAAAPASVLAFTELARGTRAWMDPRNGEWTLRPLYDGTIFHRVIPGFLVQGGDPTGTGTGGPGFSLPDENPSVSVFDRAGILALATRGPNTAGSQFFITDGPAHHLDGQYTRLGTCANLDVVRRIAEAPRGERNRPVSPTVLRSVEILAR